jgi:hypothetical protein
MYEMSEYQGPTLAERIAWLRSATPDDWHRAALDFDWSDDPEMLDWIVRQPECDAATALTVFWLAEPGCWIGDDFSGGGLTRDMCVYIANRVEAASYRRSQIAFTPDVWTRNSFVELVDLQKSLDNISFRAHRDLIRTRRGRVVELDDHFYRRYPEHHRFSAWTDLPAETNRSAKLMSAVKNIERATLAKLSSWLRV